MRIFELLEFELPKGKWVADISNAAKHEVGGDLIGLVQTAYSKTPLGSFVNSIKDVIPSNWNIIDFDQDPDVDSCVFYRKPRRGELWRGYKIQGLGHDGSRASKDKALNKVHKLLTKQGWWIESSDAMRAVLEKLGAPVVTDPQTLKALFNDPHLEMIDDVTYRRTLFNGTEVTETVFGRPVLR
jgi:hypothetical protein